VSEEALAHWGGGVVALKTNKQTKSKLWCSGMGLGNLTRRERFSYRNMARFGDHTDIFAQMNFERQGDK